MHYRSNVLRILARYGAKILNKQHLNGVKSAWSDVCSGVPQGSVIGPLLFVLFINDMPSGTTNFVSLFADDTKLFGKSTLPSGSNTIQDDLQLLQEWSEKWDLQFNKEKCQTLYLGKSNNKNIYKMSSQRETVSLQETVAEKDLGIIIDNELTFKKHISQTSKSNNGHDSKNFHIS